MKRLFVLFCPVVCLVVAAALACRRQPSASQKALEADQLRLPSEWLKQEAVRLLYDYVRIDTRHETGEQGGAEFLQRLLECDGISTEMSARIRGGAISWPVFRGKREGALLLLNHIDAPVFAEG
jgi:hypothetical protein